MKQLQYDRSIPHEWRTSWSNRYGRHEILRIVESLFNCLYVRDPSTAEHSLHMAQYSYRLARFFDKENAYIYYIGSLTHDIGKVGMSDKILKGKKKLTLDEREILREHVVDGYKILSGLGLPQIMLDIVRYHHERYDGSGYLEGMQGTDIPLAGRITAITDTYSAITSNRPYSRAVVHEEAIEIMLKDRNQFDPTILTYFENMVSKWK